jgi:hypothetical protein
MFGFEGNIDNKVATKKFDFSLSLKKKIYLVGTLGGQK